MLFLVTIFVILWVTYSISSVSAQYAGKEALSILDIQVPPYTTLISSLDNELIPGPKSSTSYIPKDTEVVEITFAVYESETETSIPGVVVDFYTNKEPYWTMKCYLEQKEGVNTPTVLNLTRIDPWVSGTVGDNMKVRCPKSEATCKRDKCEGDYAVPHEDINIPKLQQ